MACGRTKRQHAMMHSIDTDHEMSMKINSLEIWCYKCKKWTGEASASHEAEKYKVRQIQEQFLREVAEVPEFDFLDSFYLNQKSHIRQRERSFRIRLLPLEKAYIVSIAFMIEWRQFLLGNAGPPGPIDNGPLIWPPRRRPPPDDEEGLAHYYSSTSDSGWPLVINPIVNSFQHFAVANEELWRYLQAEYGGGPALSDENIPKGNPIFRELREDFNVLKERMRSLKVDDASDDEEAANLAVEADLNADEEDEEAPAFA
ncbi:hypothetical protein HDU67_007242 [Dinochytrium kinnereticum]|nr:hypothetical protein HDU67_007242 [Dinochytrium kinnereticum]